jgi:hypothetical protein
MRRIPKKYSSIEKELMYNNIARDYILLAFAIDRHIPGYIDAYFGPEEVKAEALSRDKVAIATLSREAARLAQAIAESEFETQRAEFLTAQVIAMQTTLRLLQGEHLPLAQEVELLYGLAPEWVDESRFEEAHRQLDALLPPGENLAARMTAYKKAAEVSVDAALPLLNEIRLRLRTLARQRFSLPTAEDFELVMVTDKPWSGYNWFLGKSRSRIEINTDLPLRATNFLTLMAHEGYPGHHTELSFKETRLLHEKNWQEHGIALINTPSCSISEGIANCALDTLLTAEEQLAWEIDLFARAGLKLDAAWASQVRTAFKPLTRITGNAAFLLYEQGRSKEDVAAYIEKWGLSSPVEARKSVEFISHPLYRSYIFNYTLGVDLLERLFEVKGNRQTWFTRLLTEPITPRMIVRWIER